MHLLTRRSTLLLGSGLLVLAACAPHDDPDGDDDSPAPPTMPVITAQPQAATSEGGAVELSVSATGGDLRYQWYRGGADLAGATAASLFTSETGSYDVVVRNGVGEVRSMAAQVDVATDLGRYSRSVAAAAAALLNSLSADQKAPASSPGATGTVRFEAALANVRAWSAQPGTHQGLRLDTLTDNQRRAADRLIAAALSGQGATQVFEIQRADDIYARTSGNTATGAGTYALAIFGEPRNDRPWSLQISGHQLVHNIAYNAARVSATPMVLGARPPHWAGDSARSADTGNSASTPGTLHAPLDIQRQAVAGLAQALLADSGTARAARLASPVTELFMAPSTVGDTTYRSKDYPSGTSGRGVLHTQLDDNQKNLLKAAIQAWTSTQVAAVGTALFDDYTDARALNATYVAIAGPQNRDPDFTAYPNAASRPSESAGSYLRIDGPRVWIEFLVRTESTSGAAGAKVYYTAVWRDKLADYGLQY